MENNPFDTEAAELLAEAKHDATKAEARLRAEDIKWLMSSKRGRRIVNRLLQEAGVFRISFNTNALQMSFNEGQRNSGLRLLAEVTEHCPARYTEMLEEAQND